MLKRKKGIFSFFLTETGRKITIIAAGCTTISLFLGNFLPHTFLLDKYRGIVQCYHAGIPRKLSDKVLQRFEKALNTLDVHPFERKLIKPFVVYGFDTFNAGSVKQNFGAIIGIPLNYTYTSPKDIDKQDVRFRNEIIDWSTESGKLLQEGLVLTEDEQVFGICNAILEVQTQRVLLNSLYPSVSFLAMYSLGSSMNRRMNLYARPLSLRLLLYSILGFFGIGLWSFAKDYTRVYFDIENDKRMCALGPEAVESGIRYYDKLLKKNMAIRALIGDDTYTAMGNINYLLRQKALPLTIRKSYFEMQLKELKKTLEEKNPEVAAS